MTLDPNSTWTQPIGQTAPASGIGFRRARANTHRRTFWAVTGAGLLAVALAIYAVVRGRAGDRDGRTSILSDDATPTELERGSELSG